MFWPRITLDLETQEFIFDTYRKKIDTRYTIWSVLLGLLCFILISNKFFSEEQWLLRGLRAAVIYTLAGLVISFLFNRHSLLIHLDHRYTDSLQRFEDFIKERENKSSKFNRELLQFLAFLVVLSAISYFALNSPDIVAMAAASVVTLPIAFMLRNRMYAQDKRLLKELKESLQDQALDISM